MFTYRVSIDITSGCGSAAADCRQSNAVSLGRPILPDDLQPLRQTSAMPALGRERLEASLPKVELPHPSPRLTVILGSLPQSGLF